MLAGLHGHVAVLGVEIGWGDDDHGVGLNRLKGIFEGAEAGVFVQAGQLAGVGQLVGPHVDQSHGVEIAAFGH